MPASGCRPLIRRVQTKDGLVRAVNGWAVERIGEARGEPDSADPDVVAAALARQYERYGTLIDRTIRQEELSPALAEGARGGRRAHRRLGRGGVRGRDRRRRPAPACQLIALCGVELWLVLRRDAGLTVRARPVKRSRT